MAQKTNPIALRRAAGLRRPAGAWAARWGYTDVALHLLQVARWSGALARHLDRAGVETALVALPRRRQRVEVLAPALLARGHTRRRGPHSHATREAGPATHAMVTPTPLDPWRVALGALATPRTPSVAPSPLAGLLAARLARGAAQGGAGSRDMAGLPTLLRGPLLRGWLAGQAHSGPRAGQALDTQRHAAVVTGAGVSVDHVQASAAGHWQSAGYIAGEVARRLAMGASWVRLSHGYLAPLARHPEVAGLRVRCAGRLAARSRGAARARATTARWGRTALHTLRRPVDYATAVAPTSRGAVGVKVWVAYHPHGG